MSDNLTIFGNIYEGVNTLTFTDTNSQQKVYINTADADATAEDIVSGKIAYVQGNKIIGTGSSGSSTASAKDVNFRDYDGTITNSYTKEEFATLTAMPANPTHEGLTAQGWNWSFANAKAYVAKYGRLEIGQMYITNDGKTRVYIHLEKGRTSPMLGCCPNGTVDVDWGDGTEHDTLTGTSTSTVQWTPNHAYAAPGDYVIKLTVSGSMGFYGNSLNNQYSGLLRYSSSGDGRNYAYRNVIQRIEIGSGVTSIGTYAFYNYHSLANITIPDSVTSISIYAFNYCYNLASITIPDRVTSIGQYAFSYCYSLASVIIPDSVTSIGVNAFSYCYSLASVIIPDSITSIDVNAFYACNSLASITIPDSVTSIDNSALGYCYSLASITIPDSVTSIGGSALSNCYSLASITIPDNVTSIGGSAFNSCYSLSIITIPDSVTSIGGSAFYTCRSLASVTIPDGVTSIGSKAFQNCYSVAEYHLAPTTPPTLSDTNAFAGIVSDCIIYVPYSEDHSILEAYKTATNWSTYANRMQEEPV